MDKFKQFFVKKYETFVKSASKDIIEQKQLLEILQQKGYVQTIFESFKEFVNAIFESFLMFYDPHLQGMLEFIE